MSGVPASIVKVLFEIIYPILWTPIKWIFKWIFKGLFYLIKLPFKAIAKIIDK